MLRNAPGATEAATCRVSNEHHRIAVGPRQSLPSRCCVQLGYREDWKRAAGATISSDETIFDSRYGLVCDREGYGEDALLRKPPDRVTGSVTAAPAQTRRVSRCAGGRYQNYENYVKCYKVISASCRSLCITP